MPVQMISLEGIIGSGKSTQAQLILDKLGKDIYFIPELNGFSPLKEAIAGWKTKISTTGIKFDLDDISQLASSRAEVQRSFLEKCQDFNYVLSDRSVYTALVFEQGEVNPHKIFDINKLAGVLIPDKVILLDCDPEISLKRIDERRVKEGKYFSRSIHENLGQLTLRRKLYLNLVDLFPEFEIINSGKNIDEVFYEITEVLKKWQIYA
jgi:thymidylate kinase